MVEFIIRIVSWKWVHILIKDDPFSFVQLFNCECCTKISEFTVLTRVSY